MKTRKPKSNEPNICDSMAAAAGRLGVDVDLLKYAKEDGCTAFRHGRVHLGELRKWIEVEESIRVAANRLNTTGPDAEFYPPKGNRWNVPEALTPRWDHRDSSFLGLDDTIERALENGEIDFATYEKAKRGWLAAARILHEAWGGELNEWFDGFEEGIEEARAKCAKGDREPNS